MDGMGWDGMDGMDGSQNGSSKLLYTLWVYSSICACIHVPSLSPTLLWVLKFDLKLGSSDFDIKITLCTCVFEKSC